MKVTVKPAISIPKIKPIIKWAGGKRQLLPHIIMNLPEKWNTYFEPFAGGLALIIALRNMNKISKAAIGDTNPELVNLYTEVRDNPDGLVNTIKSVHFINERESYISARRRFNEIRGGEDNKTERAAIFLYLNRHCFNGLWRVNSRGEFNVPFGRYSNPSLPEPTEIMGLSRMLQGVDIRYCDFETSLSDVRPGDFVYMDPPYEPVTRTSSFTSYTVKGFTPVDQRRLRDVCRKLDNMGTMFMVSNSFSPSIMELYSEFIIKKVEANRSINRDGSKRIGITELLITNYIPGKM
ncbi:DNA adenine methylase [Oxyplasma meridianum]|uniref:site-specific DNA-methyltransferase (adenine-specific) n=1 Tax=Oxyplasma meridianum TaxID=3073602 RepID=A0AAX4NJB2_9ARCH